MLLPLALHVASCMLAPAHLLLQQLQLHSFGVKNAQLAPVNCMAKHIDGS